MQRWPRTPSTAMGRTRELRCGQPHASVVGRYARTRRGDRSSDHAHDVVRAVGDAREVRLDRIDDGVRQLRRRPAEAETDQDPRERQLPLIRMTDDEDARTSKGRRRANRSTARAPVRSTTVGARLRFGISMTDIVHRRRALATHAKRPTSSNAERLGRLGKERDEMLPRGEVVHRRVGRPRRGAAGGVEHPRQDGDVADRVEEDAGPAEHPVHREVDVGLLAAAARTRCGAVCSRPPHGARVIALIVCTATPRSAHTAASASKSAAYRGFCIMP